MGGLPKTEISFLMRPFM